MKLTVVGAGSTYTPELVDGLVRMRDAAARSRSSHSSTPTSERLRVLGAMTRRMLARGGHPARVVDDTAARGGASTAQLPS